MRDPITREKITVLDTVLIDKVVERAAKHLPGIDLFTLEMDIVAVHMNDRRLDLTRFFTEADEDFKHDVHGIQDHIDRITGTLTDGWMPRCLIGGNRHDH